MSIYISIRIKYLLLGGFVIYFKSEWLLLAVQTLFSKLLSLDQIMDV